jgi:hypothetical protein
MSRARSSADALATAEALLLGGDLRDAADLLTDALCAFGSDDALLRLRAAVRLRLGDFSGALADLDALSATTPADDLTRSILWERAGDLTLAAAWAESARAKASGDSRLASRLTERLVGLWRASGRCAEVERLLAAETDWRWLHLRGDAARDCGDLAAAARHYGAALDDLYATFAAARSGRASAFVVDQQQQLLCKRIGCWRALRRFDAARTDLHMLRKLGKY